MLLTWLMPSLCVCQSILSTISKCCHESQLSIPIFPQNLYYALWVQCIGRYPGEGKCHHLYLSKCLVLLHQFFFWFTEQQKHAKLALKDIAIAYLCFTDDLVQFLWCQHHPWPVSPQICITTGAKGRLHIVETENKSNCHSCQSFEQHSKFAAVIFLLSLHCCTGKQLAKTFFLIGHHHFGFKRHWPFVSNRAILKWVWLLVPVLPTQSILPRVLA